MRSLLSKINGNRLFWTDQCLILHDAPSWQEFIFIPQSLADRLKDYIREKGIQPHQRIFLICYEAAREMVAKAGSVVGIHPWPRPV
jgi:integrase/recombinase XerD